MTIHPVESETDHPSVVAVGGSAGSVQPLVEIVRGLPGDLAAAVLVTIHIGEQSRLPRILSRSGPLPATHVQDRELLEPGRIYIAPPGRHLIARDGLALLSPSPQVNRHPPAVDVMFASVAEWAAARTVAVVLSGALDDGAVGAAIVAQAGGQVLVQDPAEAEFASMPRLALAAAPGARALPVRQLAQQIRDSVEVGRSFRSDSALQEARMGAAMEMVETGEPGYRPEEEFRLTRLTCPECGGGLAQVDRRKSATSAATSGIYLHHRPSRQRRLTHRRRRSGARSRRWRSKLRCSIAWHRGGTKGPCRIMIRP
jgi:two-component system, chemotaxis family, protein-glutamate methylesterase/glutaminase